MRYIFLVLSFIFLVPIQASSLNFKQVGYFPLGICDAYGYIKGSDINHDGFQDLVFSTEFFHLDSLRIAYYGYRPYNRYVFEDSVQTPSLFWDLGDLDGDSLMDLIVQRNDTAFPHGIRVFEPPSYWSFPKLPVWSWTYEFNGSGVQNMYITDLDQDGLKEILTGDGKVVYVFENRGDNQYQKVFSDTILEGSPPFAVGDFDGDGRMEFVRGTYGGAPSIPTVYLYECIGNDQYQMTWSDTLNTWNMRDVITGPDLDGDGKLEFIIGDFHRSGPSWVSSLWIYESTGDDQYEVIFADSIPIITTSNYYVHSDCGDVDWDGRPELIWAINHDWMVYKSNGNNQFQRVFSAYGNNNHVSTNVHIHDMNGNGYPEIIESGGSDRVSVWGETHIWEVEACQVVYPNGGETLYCDTSYAIRWRNVAPFVADSFSLFFSTDSGRSYSLIAHGIPGSDSSYVWTVPDTLSDTCFIMLWAYQNATGWDFSDSHFRIRDGTGVSDHPPSTIHHPLLPLRVSPNPFITYAQAPGYEKSSFALYDVSGRKVGVYKGDRIGVGLSTGIYFLKPESQDAKPLRVVKLR